MKVSIFKLTALLTVLSYFSCGSAMAKLLEDYRWIEVKSENFRVQSMVKEKETRKLVQTLEYFRSAVQLVTNIKNTNAFIPTDIYVMRKSADFKKVGVDLKSVSGVFVPGMRRNVILVRNGSLSSEVSIMLHEYSHFLVNNHAKAHYPRWFSEGFAEYLSSISEDKKNFKIGLTPKHRLSSFRYSGWIPIRKILTSEKYYQDWNSEKKSMFYAESWGLVHYLLNQPNFQQHMTQYLKQLEKDEDPLSAFESSFGISAVQANRNVRKYLAKGRLNYFNVPKSSLLPNLEITTTNMSKEQAALSLGTVALSRGSLKNAEHWFTVASEDSNLLGRASAGLGDIKKFKGEFSVAEPYFQKVQELCPSDPYCQLDIAEYWHDRALYSKDSDARPVSLELARTHYLKAWSLDDQMPETYFQFGKIYALTGSYDKALDAYRNAEFLLPSDLSIQLHLAEMYLQLNMRKEAKKTAESVLAWSRHRGGAFVERATEVLELMGIEPAATEDEEVE